MNTKLLTIYMDAVQMPRLLPKVPKDRNYQMFLVALTALLFLLTKFFGEWLAEYIFAIQKAAI